MGIHPAEPPTHQVSRANEGENFSVLRDGCTGQMGQHVKDGITVSQRAARQFADYERVTRDLRVIQ